MEASQGGSHLIIDASVYDAAVFSHTSLKKLMTNLATILDMKILSGPDFVDVPFEPAKLSSKVFQDEGGTTGHCVISTSHMSIHTWGLRKFFHMDVFSCKQFDSESAIRYISEHLRVQDMSIVSIIRYDQNTIPVVKDAFSRHHKW